MSLKKVSENQPENFKFTEVNLAEAKDEIRAQTFILAILVEGTAILLGLLGLFIG